MAPIHTGSYLVDQFAEYFVYFYVGYAFAPQIFRFVAWTQRNTAAGRSPASWLYAVINGLLVFSPGYEVGAHDIQMGLAALPGVRLVLALAGSLALCVVAALLARLPWMNWLRWLGEHSLVVYLAFVLPMSFSRIALDKIGLIDDTTSSRRWSS